MKKTIVSQLAFLTFCCVPALSQEVEEYSSFVPEVSVVARLDACPQIPLSEEAKVPFDPVGFFGSSSLSTLIDGALGDYVSYSFGFNWLSTDPRSLYVTDIDDETSGANLFYGDRLNFFNWGNVSLNLGGFSLTLGKDFTAVGSIEIDQYDFDSYYLSSSYFWQNYVSYQWGATAAYTLPDEINTLKLQWQTSPYGERIFASKLFMYALQWRGEYEWGTFNYSTNFIQYAPKSYLNLIALGHEFYIGDFTLRFDYMNRAKTLRKFFGQEQALKLDLYYNILDKAEVGLWGNADLLMTDPTFYAGEEGLGNLYSAGVMAKWYPLKDSQDLRVHALLGYNGYLFGDSLAFNFGITYNFSLTNLLSRK